MCFRSCIRVVACKQMILPLPFVSSSWMGWSWVTLEADWIGHSPAEVLLGNALGIATCGRRGKEAGVG
jgi:hypothetical protein